MRAGQIARIRSSIAAATLLLVLACSPPAGAADRTAPAADPHRDRHAVFLQAGVADETDMLIGGVTRDWSWSRDLRVGTVQGYWEMSFGRWATESAHGNGSAWVTQLGITPVLRLYPAAWGGRWFVEAGIGANFLLPVYRSREKRFSTTFNFGDHLAVGRSFGERGRHSIVLRLQHFSNAGIKHPNPGENFVQLRYARRF